MAEFTPTSSIAWTQNHAFAIGMEANFTDPADTVASITQNIPFSIGQLQIFGGSLTMQGDQKAAALFRIAIIGDAAGGDGGLGPGSVLILNHVLNVAGGQPCTIPIAPFTVPCANRAIPVPPDGSPYQMTVTIRVAGAQVPIDAEIELCGMWSWMQEHFQGRGFRSARGSGAPEYQVICGQCVVENDRLLPQVLWFK